MLATPFVTDGGSPKLFALTVVSNGQVFSVNAGRHKDVIAPDGRSRPTKSGKLDLPSHVLIGGPVCWIITICRNTI